MSKIKNIEWVFLFVVMGALDAFQFLIDFTGIGAIINSFADPLIGVVLAGYFQLRGVSMIKHPTRLISLLCIVGLESITGGLAPAWIIDIWYIRHSVKRKKPNIKNNSQQNNFSNHQFNLCIRKE